MKTGWRKFAKGMAWFCTVWLALFGVATTPSFASVIFYVAAVALLPIQAWQNILEKYLPHFRKYKVLGVVVLFLVAALTAPDSVDTVESPESDLSGEIIIISDGEAETAAIEKEADSVELEEPKGETEQTEVLFSESSVESSGQESVSETNSGPVAEAEPVSESEPEPESESESEFEPEPEPVGTDYVGNVSSKKFHYSWCSSVKKMKESNKYYFNGTRDQMIEKGYEPCGNCHP